MTLKKIRLNRHVYDLSVDYDTIDISEILDIQKYLIQKDNDIIQNNASFY